MQRIPGLADHPRYLQLRQQQRTEQAGLQIFTLSHDRHIRLIDVQLLEQFLVGAVTLRREGDVIRHLLNTLWIAIDGGDLISQLVQRAGNTAPKTTKADHGDALRRTSLLLAANQPVHLRSLPHRITHALSYSCGSTCIPDRRKQPTQTHLTRTIPIGTLTTRHGGKNPPVIIEPGK